MAGSRVEGRDGERQVRGAIKGGIMNGLENQPFSKGTFLQGGLTERPEDGMGESGGTGD